VDQDDVRLSKHQTFRKRCSVFVRAAFHIKLMQPYISNLIAKIKVPS
jgi:hypothetical protein